VYYGDAERGALTLHFESSDQTRLFGSPAFIYFPTAAWLDYYWSKVWFARAFASKAAFHACLVHQGRMSMMPS
jgi:hypothetical protein